eukprot:10416132-Heterocapsa_arctica.AAC.1
MGTRGARAPDERLAEPAGPNERLLRDGAGAIAPVRRDDLPLPDERALPGIDDQLGVGLAEARRVDARGPDELGRREWGVRLPA